MGAPAALLGALPYPAMALTLRETFTSCSRDGHVGCCRRADEADRADCPFRSRSLLAWSFARCFERADLILLCPRVAPVLRRRRRRGLQHLQCARGIRLMRGKLECASHPQQVQFAHSLLAGPSWYNCSRVTGPAVRWRGDLASHVRQPDPTRKSIPYNSNKVRFPKNPRTIIAS